MFLQWFPSWRHWESVFPEGPRRVIPRRLPGRGRTRMALRVEELEPRAVPSTTSLGSFVGRVYLSGHVDAENDTFQFDVDPPVILGIVQAPSEDLDLQISAPTGGTASVSIFPDTPEFVELHQAEDPPDVGYTSSLHVPASAGPWIADVSGFGLFGADYRLALATDPAGGEFFSAGGDPISISGLELGTLKTESPKTAHDFIGYLDTSAHPGKDLIDIYSFDVTGSGRVEITLDQLEKDMAGGTVAADLQLYRDVDEDFHLELSERIDFRTASVGQSATIGRTLAPGHYEVMVSRLAPPPAGTLLGGSNYRLRVSYAVPDSAGNTLATARDITAFFTGGSPLVDYLSAGDPIDIYQFTVNGGPFIFNALLAADRDPNPPATEPNFDLDIIRDANGNGVVDSGEILVSGTNAAGHENIFSDAQVSDTYYVRVRRVESEGPYTLMLFVRNSDIGGNSLATATNFGNFFGRTEFADSVSSFDPNDIFKFSLTAQGTITASFPSTGIGSDPDLQLIQDANGNGVIDSGEILASGTHLILGGVSLSRTVAAGTYYLNVKWVPRATTTYHLTLTADTAGGSPRQARGMGLSGDAAGTIEFVGPGDSADFYALNIPGPLQLNIFTSLFGEPFTLSVIRDANGNNIVDPGETLFQKTIATAADLRQTVNVITKGETVFVRVAPGGPDGTNYGIVFATAPVDNAGNTPADARDLGVLGGTRNFRDFVGDGSIDTNARGDAVLGADDVDDFYRFTLGNNGPYTFTALTSNLTGNADIQLIRDDNRNERVDDREVLASSSNTGTTGDVIMRTLDRPGVYYLRVFRPGNGFSGSADYTLSLGTALVSPDNPGNSLQTARTLGALTTTTPLSASEFVGAIDRDDFYAFSVPGPGILSVSRNAPTSGIPFEVIQDANFNFVIDPGETLATSGGELTPAGPAKFSVSLPAAGIYYVHVASPSVDVNYALALGFSNSVGSFVLTPRHAAVNPGEHVSLGLQWTVPDGSWHGLHDVELRVRDAFGTLALAKFNEADNTLSLFNPDRGEFGPAMAIGGDGTLANRYVTIFLRTSSRTAAGPDSPTVTLTLDMVFKEVASGRHLILEAAASDDFGRFQDFAVGGTLDVAPKPGSGGRGHRV
jgi:hypothetical protein